MSGSFTGFSEEYIKNLTNKESEHSTRKSPTGTKIVFQGKRSSVGRLQKSKRPLSMNNRILDEKFKNNIETIPEDAKLTKDDDEEKSSSNNNDNKVQEPAPCDATRECENTVRQEEMPERKIDITQIQQRQKLIEEQNRKRKEILAKALAVRTQQTREEAQKLNEIREEFKKLDVLLSGDVNILRKEIENASFEYMEAEIEKEFLEAKLILHQKSERKEMLTEHLCTVIEKNEERKAEKLNELMIKLNLRETTNDTLKKSNEIEVES
ncbi:hypothetical protein FQA39_LY12475 [Lamprigera yunnana]|nr:hypothetical protein FQA39_LY12475 [Lamprigera yunnana]